MTSRSVAQEWDALRWRPEHLLVDLIQGHPAAKEEGQCTSGTSQVASWRRTSSGSGRRAGRTDGQNVVVNF